MKLFAALLLLIPALCAAESKTITWVNATKNTDSATVTGVDPIA